MRRRLFLGAVWGCLLAAVAASAQPRAVRVCVVPDNAGAASRPMPEHDASQLALELSKRSLPGGALVEGIAVPGKASESLNAAIKERACDYVVRIWRYESVYSWWRNSPAMIPGPMPGLPQPAVFHDPDTIDFELRKAGSATVIARGVGLVPTIHHGEDHPSSTPYPSFAEEIVAHLSPPR